MGCVCGGVCVCMGCGGELCVCGVCDVVCVGMICVRGVYGVWGDYGGVYAMRCGGVWCVCVCVCMYDMC